MFARRASVYRDAAGRTLGSPPIEVIAAAVEAHRRGRLETFQREEAAKVADFARRADAADDSSKKGRSDEHRR